MEWVVAAAVFWAFICECAVLAKSASALQRPTTFQPASSRGAGLRPTVVMLSLHGASAASASKATESAEEEIMVMDETFHTHLAA